MTANVERGIADGHPNPALLRDLERVIYGAKPAADLDNHEDWKKA